jgi:hypothetical protein
MIISVLHSIPSVFLKTQSSMSQLSTKLVQVAENIFKMVSRRGLTIELILHGCYAMRIPMFYLERYVHDQPRKSILERFSDGFFVASDVVGAVNFFKKFPILQLGKLAAKVGKGPFGQMLKRIPLPPILSAFRGMAFLCYGAYSVKKLSNPLSTKAEKRQACIDIASAIAEIAFAILIVAGCTFMPLMLPLSALAFSLMAISIGHSIMMSIRTRKVGA